ncbi:MAG: ROK family protein [Acidimicrobiales bacterium]
MGVAVGLDLGGTKCLGLAVGAGGAILAERRVPTPGEGGDALLDVMAAVAVDVAAAAGGPLASVGVGAPGLVDTTGVLRFAPNLRQAAGLGIGAGLAERLGVAVQVDNDVTCAAYGEWVVGAAAGAGDVVLAALGTGIGGGLVVGGRLARGAHGYAGEIGHMVVDPHGPACPCGQRGCWERFASGGGLARLAREAAVAGTAPGVVVRAGGDVEAVRGEHVTEAARAGDQGARAILDDFAWWLALGLANLTNIFDPERIVLGGGLVVDAPLWLDATRAAFAGRVVGAGSRPEVPIVVAALGAEAGAVGAALLGRQRSAG